MSEIAAPVELASRRSRLVEGVSDFIRRRPLGAIGGADILLMLLVAVIAPLIAPYEPLAVDFAAMLTAPSS
jgi:peptide/nickel transport system permease protein